MVSPLNQRLIEAFGRRPQIDIFGEDELDLPETQGSLRDVLSPTPSETLLGQFAGPPTGLEAATGGITAPLGGPFQQATPVGGAPVDQSEGGFLDRFLGAARPGSVGAGLREGFFGGARAQRTRQLEEAKIAGVRSLTAQRNAAAQASMRAAQSPLGKLRRDFDQEIISAATFDAARKKAVNIPPEELVLLQNPENPNDVRTFREGNAQVDKLIGQGFEEVGKRQRIETAEAGGFTEDKKTIREVRAQGVAAEVFGKNASDFVGFLRTNPDANTLTARLAGFGNFAATEARALSRQFGVEIPAFSVGDFDESFSRVGLASASAQTKSAVLDLALSAAAARGLGTGRALTDKDIDRAFDLIGGNINNPEILAQVISNLNSRIKSTAEITAQRQGVPIPPIPEFQFGGAPATANFGDMSDEELLRSLGQ